MMRVGADICSVRRIAQLVHKFDGRFLQKAFHESEVLECESRYGEFRTPDGSTHETVARYFAARWAAKEALIKAIGNYRFLFPEVAVVSGVSTLARPAAPPRGTSHVAGDNGAELAQAARAGALVMQKQLRSALGDPAEGRRPRFVFHGAAAARLLGPRGLNGPGGLLRAPPLLSLSHEDEYALAFVVLPAVPAGAGDSAGTEPPLV
jgi:phosphopantetheine--protein transferase-like protein